MSSEGDCIMPYVKNFKENWEIGTRVKNILTPVTSNTMP